MRLRRLLVLALVLVIAASLAQLARAQSRSTVYLPLVSTTDTVQVVIPTEATPTIVVRSAYTQARNRGRAVVGEVVNMTRAPAYQVKITGIFYNSLGQQVASDDTLAFLPMTAPDQRNPFEVYVAEAPADVARVELSVSWRNTPTEEYRPITVVSQELRQEGVTTITGTVRNDTPVALSAPEVAVTFYDAAGNVVGVAVAAPAVSPLPAGSTSAYSVSAGSRGLSFARYTVQAQGTVGP